MVRTDSPDTASLRTVSHVRRWFALLAGLVGLWVIGLGVLSFQTANPITLNRDQILEATDVLTAVVVDVRTGQIRVEHSWKNTFREKQLALNNLHETKPAPNQRLLIPVTSLRQRWQVTPSKLPREPSLVYPVTEESERQLRHLLKTGRLP